MIIRDFGASRHLASRLEMGVDDTLCEARIGNNVDQAFNSMLPDGESKIPAPELAAWEEMAAFYGGKIELQREIRMQAMMDGRTLTSWWLEQIHKTSSPLLERMTLFWHNHFTSDIDKVTWPQFMYKQNQLLRENALGNFEDLLQAIVRDPAMLMFLDSAQNVVKSPNENFARELLELFTLGAGNFEEADIINAARAFTGWGVDFKTGEFKFKPGLHDNKDKEFMGRVANLNGDDIINILLQEPRTAEHIAEKFWAEFINRQEPDPMIIKSWAKEFRESGYEIKALLKAVIHSQAFWDEENRGSQIKSPVEFTVGMLRELDIQLDDYEFLRKANQQLGQDLFRPPDVKGWRGGKEWITNTRLIRRYDLIAKLISEHTGDEKSMLEDQIIKPRMMKSKENKGNGMFRRLLDKMACNANEGGLTRWLMPVPPIALPDCEQPLTDMFLTLLKDPTYQLR